MGTDDDIADLRRRVDALEEHAALEAELDLARRLGVLEERVDLEADLRAAMDADLADTRTFQRVVLRQLNAVGQTLSEHSRTLHDITTVLVRMEARLDGHDEALARNDEAIDRHDEALSRHDGMLADILAAVRPGGPSAPGAQPG